MNYIAEINAFEQWLETHYLPIPAQLMWYKLMSISNRAGWSEWVTVDNLRLMAALQMSREATLIKARGELIKAGLIDYQKGKKGSPNKYRMISFTFKNEVQSVGQSVVYPVVQSVVQSVGQSVAIYKHKQNKTKDIPPISPLEQFGEFWDAYPGKSLSSRHKTEIAYADAVMAGVDEAALVAAAGNYADACRIQGTEAKYIKKPDNFLRDNTFAGYLPGEYIPPEPPKKKETAADKYNRMMSRDIDMDALERDLLGGDSYDP